MNEFRLIRITKVVQRSIFHPAICNLTILHNYGVFVKINLPMLPAFPLMPFLFQNPIHNATLHLED